MAVPAAIADHTKQDAMVAVFRLMTSTARPAMRLKVLNSKVKLKDASNPYDDAKERNIALKGGHVKCLQGHKEAGAGRVCLCEASKTLNIDEVKIIQVKKYCSRRISLPRIFQFVNFTRKQNLFQTYLFMRDTQSCSYVLKISCLPVSSCIFPRRYMPQATL